MVSPYVVLQVDPDADEETLEAAYRERVKETHPDHGGSATEFRLVQLAYEEIKSGTYWTPEGQTRLADARDAARDGAYAEPARSQDRGRHAGGRRRSPRRQDAVGSNGRTTPARVEYVDYEVLVDHGWEIDDPDLFEKADAADLPREEHGTILVDPGQSVLEAAEESGHDWPFSCRGGACANCAIAVVEGDVAMPFNTILPEEMEERGIRLSCNGEPVVDDLQIVFNVKHLPELDELRLPARSFAKGGSDD